MPSFVPGRELSAAFYADVIGAAVADVPHAAGLLGWGSDVLGYDTERSTDHGWGPRLQLFVESSDIDEITGRVDRAIPESFRGWPTHFGWDQVASRHWVEVWTVREWLTERLGYVPGPGMSRIDWLVTPQQRLLEVVGGEVFRDDTGDLTRIRALLEWYPDDLWLWLLACQWQRVAEEEAFVGRCAEVGDDLGSRVVAARLVRDLMRLAFLYERRYAPYSKWLGSAFAALDAAPRLSGPLERALRALGYPERESALVDAYECLAELHNDLGVTAWLDPSTRRYHGRPYRVVHADRFVAACLERIDDPWLRRLPLVGAIDQFVSSTDVLDHADRMTHFRGFYERELHPDP